MTKLLGDTLDVLANLQTSLIEFLDNDEVKDCDFAFFLQKLDESDIVKSSSQMSLFLQCLSNVFNYHYESVSQFNYLQQILEHLSNFITNLLNQNELYSIAIKSKIFLIYLIKSQLLDINFFIKNLIHLSPKSQLLHYLAPEVNEYIKLYQNQFDPIVQEFFSSPDIDDDYNDDYENDKNPYEALNMDAHEYVKLREKGENTSIFCKEIRENNFEDFNILIEKTGMKINKKIEFQLFDSNDYPIEKDKMPSIFEYAAYKGSIEICKYLTLQQVKIDENSWFCAIHGRNADIIHLLEEHGIKCNFERAFLYAIKCHNNSIAEYIVDQYLDHSYLSSGIIECISSYNFSYLKTLIARFEKDDDKNQNNLQFIEILLKYNYCNTIDYLIKSNQCENKSEFINLVINENNPILLKLLLKNYSEFQQDWIEKAIKKDSIEVIKVLLENKSILKLITTVFFYSKKFIIFIFIFNKINLIFLLFNYACII